MFLANSCAKLRRFALGRVNHDVPFTPATLDCVVSLLTRYVPILTAVSACLAEEAFLADLPSSYPPVLGGSQRTGAI